MTLKKTLENYKLYFVTFQWKYLIGKKDDRSAHKIVKIRILSHSNSFRRNCTPILLSLCKCIWSTLSCKCCLKLIIQIFTETSQGSRLRHRCANHQGWIWASSKGTQSDWSVPRQRGKMSRGRGSIPRRRIENLRRTNDHLAKGLQWIARFVQQTCLWFAYSSWFHYFFPIHFCWKYIFMYFMTF